MRDTMSRRQKKTQENRECILKTAYHLFNEFGYAQTTMVDIQKETGLSNGTIYNLFHNKRDILMAVYQQYTQAITKLSDDMREKLDDPAKEIMHFVLEYENQVMSVGRPIEAALYQNHLSEGFEKDKLVNQISEEPYVPYGWTIRNELMTYLNEVEKNGKLKSGLSIQTVSDCIYTFARGLIMTWTFSKEEYDLIERSTPLWETLLQGFFA